MKVKEPLAAERKKLSRGQVLFTYLHLAPDRAQTEELMARGATAIAYETVTSQQGSAGLSMSALRGKADMMLRTCPLLTICGHAA